MGCKNLSYYQTPLNREGELPKKLGKLGASRGYNRDHLGNTRVVYTPLNRQCDQSTAENPFNIELDYAADFYPYGKVLREYNPKAEKYLTTHHERDTETGLDYRGARYYDADIARFLSLDPLAMDYTNLSDYVYVAGNPVKYVDPDGRVVRPTDDKQRITNPNNSGVDASGNTNANKVYSMTIATNTSNNGMGIEGHAWIEITNKNSGETMTFSLWGNTGSQEFHINKELNMSQRTSRSLDITQEQFDKFKLFVKKPSNTDWTCLNTCADFSTEAWNAVTGENLNSTTALGLTTPVVLSQSIYDANGNKFSNTYEGDLEPDGSVKESSAKSSNSNSSSGSGSQSGSSTSSGSSSGSVGGESSSAGSIIESSVGGGAERNQ